MSDDFAWSPLSGLAKVLSWTTFRRSYFPEYPPPQTVVALELAEGPLFISWPVDVEPSDLREGMTLELWADAADRFGEYNLPVFDPPAARLTRSALHIGPSTLVPDPAGHYPVVQLWRRNPRTSALSRNHWATLPNALSQGRARATSPLDSSPES